jgi:CSLREA domain-containing protein
VTVSDVQQVLRHWGVVVAGEGALAHGRVRLPATFTVNSAGDESDNSPGDGICRTSAASCTLRAALEESNVRPGAESIVFDIREASGACPALVTRNS